MNMTSGQLLLEGVQLMLIGMGAVCVFLVLLIGCIRLMSVALARFDSGPALATARPAPIAAPATEVDADTLAAIQLAIHRHRARRG